MDSALMGLGFVVMASLTWSHPVFDKRFALLVRDNCIRGVSLSSHPPSARQSLAAGSLSLLTSFFDILQFADWSVFSALSAVTNLFLFVLIPFWCGVAPSRRLQAHRITHSLLRMFRVGNFLGRLVVE